MANQKVLFSIPEVVNTMFSASSYNSCLGNSCLNNHTASSCSISNSFISSPQKMPKETKSYVYTDKEKLKVSKYECGDRIADLTIMPEIKNIKIFDGKAIAVTFSDGETEKASIKGDDVFTIEQGLSICITKKLLDMICFGNGSSIYNKVIDYACKFYATQEINRKEKEAKEECIKNKAQKRVIKEEKRRAKRQAEQEAAEAARREEEIEIQKEAYLRAMREFNNTSNTVAAE